jgi:hypothetical protein
LFHETAPAGAVFYRVSGGNSIKNGETMQRIQVEITRRYIGEEGHMRPGNVQWVTPKRARELITNGVAKIVAPGPTETKAEPVENNVKKSSSVRQGGRSTRSRSSSARGKATPSSASPAAPALPQNNADTLNAHGAAGLTFTS